MRSLSRIEVLEGEVVVAGAGKDVIVLCRVRHGRARRRAAGPSGDVAAAAGSDRAAGAAGEPTRGDGLPGGVWRRRLSCSACSAAIEFEQVVFEGTSDTPHVSLPELLPNAHYVLRVRAVHVAGLEGQPRGAAWSSLRCARPRPLRSSRQTVPRARPRRCASAGILQVPVSSIAFSWHATRPSPNQSRTCRGCAIPASASNAHCRPASTTGALLHPIRSRRKDPSAQFARSGAHRRRRSLSGPSSHPRRSSCAGLAIVPTGATASGLPASPSSPRSSSIRTPIGLALELPRPAAGRYFLRIQAVEPDGYEGPYERPTIVDVPGPPAAPRSLQPADAAQVSGTPLEFRWEPAGAGSSYRFQLADNPAFDPLYVDAPDLKRAGFTLERPLAPGSYFWRVAASTQTDGEGDFSPTQSLRRLPLAAAPACADRGPLGPGAALGGGAGRSSIRCGAGPRRGFSGPVDQSEGGGSAAAHSAPPGRSLLHARARTWTRRVSRAPTVRCSRSTCAAALPAPRLAEPQDGAVVPADAAQLRWHAQQEPARYRVQLATDARFTVVVLDRRGLEGTSFGVGQTLEPGVYLWRVAATTESDGEGAFSEARTLRVPPTAPELSAPEVAERSARVPLA